MTDIQIALAQIRVAGGRAEANRDRAVDAVERAADRGADLVVLPELFTAGYFAFDAYARAAEPLEGPTVSRLRAVARDRSVAVLCGTVVEDLAATDGETPAGEGLANTAVLLDADGDRRLVYRKRHLFGYGSEEADRLVAGQRLPTASLYGFEVAVATCYDLRFPDQFRALDEAGATLFLVPSAWPYPRLEHWTTLTRARAIETQAYLAAANGSADFEGATLLGRSAVYDPWGTAVAAAGDGPDLVLADVSPDRVASVREEFPVRRDRRSRPE